MDLVPIPKILERSWTPAPLWQVTRRTQPRHITADMTCDTVVVGAGITGLAIAENLSQTQSVVVLDARRIGESSSGWNAGILSVDTTVDLHQVELQFGVEQAQTLVASLSDILAHTKRNLQLGDNIWQSGRTLYVAAKSMHSSYLEQELGSRQKYNLPARILDAEAMKDTYRGFCSALELGNEHAVHPVELLLTLSERICQRGGLVFEDSPVGSWEHTGDRFVVKCGNGYLVTAKNLVLCTGLGNSEFAESKELSRLVVPVVGHVLVTQPSAHFAALATNGGTIALWDSLQLYHYVRYLPDGRVLVGGEETPGVVPGKVLKASDPHIQKLYHWAKQHHTTPLPPIEHCWKASLVVPADGLPMVKSRRIGDNTLISAVTDGLPFGMLLGSLVSQSLQVGGNPLPPMLSSGRRLVLAARLLQALPGGKAVRALAFRAVFAALRFWDWAF
jgi:glycine/D-amino acid oxidase-like deaminating enzyme